MHLLFFILLFFYTHTGFASSDCLNSLVESTNLEATEYRFFGVKLKTTVKNSIQSIIETTDLKLDNDSTPNMFSIEEDKKRMALYKDDVLPKSLQEFLPPHANVISRPLNKAEEKAILKMTNPSNVVVVKSKLKFNGVDTSTNIFLSKNAILGNPGRDKKWLVGPEMKAVNLWIHGGGTSTASGSSGQDVIDYFDDTEVAIYAPDMPLHGEGTDYPFKTEEEVLDYLAANIEQDIHPDVRLNLFLSGHSMGGQYATIIQKLTEKLKYRRMFKKIFALSFVADPSHGGSYLAKQEAEEKANKARDERRKEIAASDWDFLSNVVKNGKAVSKPMYHVRMISKFNNWQSPENNGSNRVPMDAFMGKYDGLTMIGHELSIDKYFSQFLPEHTKLFIIDRRDTPEGKNQKIGHGIFKAPDVFARIRSEIEKFVGEPITVNGNPPKDASSQFRILMLKAFRLWNHNFAFREYAKLLNMNLVGDGKDAGKIKREIGQLIGYKKQMAQLQKSLGDTSSDNSQYQEAINKVNIPDELKSIAVIDERLNNNYNALKLLHIPENHKLKDKIAKNVELREKALKQISELTFRLNDIYKVYNGQKNEFIRVTTSLNKFLKYISSPKIKQAKELASNRLDKAYAQYEAAEKAQQEHFNNHEMNQTWSAETLYSPPEELLAAELKFKKLLGQYNTSISQLQRVQRNAVMAGEFYFESQKDFEQAKLFLKKAFPQNNSNHLNDVIDSWSDYKSIPEEIVAYIQQFYPHMNGQLRKNSFLESFIKNHQTLNELSGKRTEGLNLLAIKVKEYSEMLPEYGRVELLTLYDVLNLPYEESQAWVKEIGKALSRFEEIWNYRVPVETNDVNTL